MWSLGVLMAGLMLGFSLFPGHVDYDVLRQIVDLLSYPSDHLLHAGMHSNRYFVKRRNGKWRMKTFKEFGYHWTAANRWFSRISNLDSLDTLQIGIGDMMEPAEKTECNDLLKAMLRMDSNERITPSQVLAHPFITRGTLQPSSDSIHETLAQPPQTPSISTSLECINWWDSDSECHESDSSQSVAPSVILARPAPPDLVLVEDSRQSEEACPLDLLEELFENSSTESSDMPQEDTESSDTTFVPHKEQKRKKKNRFERLWDWTKATFTSRGC